MDDLLNEHNSPEPKLDLDRAQFLAWRTPRLGAVNPERLNNPVWEALIRTRLSAWAANQQMQGPDSCEAGPAWCFQRFGQSSTRLPDGRVVLIGGEHEDFYDADFFIYNDVVIAHPDGRLDILGYPHEAFPPTDFHSATLLSDKIVLIGSLGYSGSRRPGEIQVAELDLASLSIRLVPTSGDSPGWLHGHTAELCEDGRAIAVRRGQIWTAGPDSTLVENIDDWQLDLGNCTWIRLTRRNWMRWECCRPDRRPNHLWRFRHTGFWRDLGRTKEFETDAAELEKEFGPIDWNLVAQLYRPAVAHEPMPAVADEYNVFRIRINGVVVRYVEDSHFVQLTVEGELSPDLAEALARELQSKLSVLEHVPYVLKRL